MAEGDSGRKIKESVRDAYGQIARNVAEEPIRVVRASCCGPARDEAESIHGARTTCSCCGPTGQVIDAADAARLYPAEELAGLPQTVTEASLGCGNPLAIADLRPGEVVLDLGSGGGIDCFLAARRVGPAGRVIGLDMTPDMIRLAQRNAKKVGAANVEFRLGEMEDIPLPDRSVDAVISNCVINLSPDKDAVFAEAYRVLRPGGRLSVSDVVVDGELPQAIRERPDIWAACVSGALDEAEYLAKIRAAGFEEVEVLSRDRAEEQEPAGWEDGPDVRELLEGTGWTPRELARRVFSVKVRAVKPVGRPA
ncbi:MAG TPA: arsenite methyltransferase [Anaerolineae bacterium]|nr:arsenite methyltransferase [Anaerolineae bacterium]